MNRITNDRMIGPSPQATRKPVASRTRFTFTMGDRSSALDVWRRVGARLPWLVVSMLMISGCTQFHGDPNLSSFVTNSPQRNRSQSRNEFVGQSSRRAPVPSQHQQVVHHGPALPPPNISADDLETRFVRARVDEQQGHKQRAVDQYRQLSSDFPSDGRAFHRLAVLYDKAGRGDLSAPKYLMAMQLDPQNAEILTDYGYSRYLQGDTVLAERTLRRATQLNAGLKRAHTNLALVLQHQGKQQPAIASMQKAGLSAAQARASLQRLHR